MDNITSTVALNAGPDDETGLRVFAKSWLMDFCSLAVWVSVFRPTDLSVQVPDHSFLIV